MPQPGMMDWQEHVRPSPAGTSRLHIFFPPDQPGWPDTVSAFWSRNLSGLSPVKQSIKAAVLRGRVPHAGHECYFKRLHPRVWQDWFMQPMRGSRARRALAGTRLLQTLGFDAPEPCCLVEERLFGLVRDSAFITLAVADAPSVIDWIRQPTLAGQPEGTLRREFLDALAREVARLHRQSIYHGDMNLSNILCRRMDDQFHFIWTDNERTRRYRQLPHRLRVHNLVQMNKWRNGVTLLERMRFWRTYRECAAVPASLQKAILRDVLAETQERWK